MAALNAVNQILEKDPNDMAMTERKIEIEHRMEKNSVMSNKVDSQSITSN